MVVRLRERFSRRWVWRLPPHSGAVALTFDDGPDPRTTPLLVAELTRLGILSTHFVVGSKVAAEPQLLRDVYEAGHVVANHAFVHESFLFRSPAYQERSILAAEQAVWHAIGKRCHFFRPCFGQYNSWTLSVLRQLGYAGVLWSLMAGDWVEQNDDALWRRLRSRLHEGAIIVLHDGHPTTERVIRLLPRLADEIHKRGWDFVPLLPSALISSGNDT